MKRVLKKGLNSLGFDIVKTKKTTSDVIKYIHHHSRDSVKRRAFYNISAGGHFGFGGDFFHPCWTNIDVDLGDTITPQYNPETDIAHDPLELGEIPLETGSAELFHCRFAIEHITDEAALKLFKEIHRVLKKGGVFKVVCPNFRLDYEAYQSNDLSYFWWVDVFSRPGAMEQMGFAKPLNRASIQQVMLAHFAANASEIHRDGADHPISDAELDDIMQSNPFEKAMDTCTARCSIEKQKIYRKNHINWWTHQKTTNFLQDAGFKKTVTLTPGQSVSPVMRNNALFDSLWNEVALYVEGIK